MTQSRVNHFLFLLLCGFFLGTSVVAPGVSGSIMAVMMGIYRDLINIASNPFKNFKQNFFYLLPMGIGALLSVILFVKVLSFTFQIYPLQSKFLFIGLIAGSLVEVFQQARKVSFKRRYLLGTLAALGIAVFMGLLGDSASTFAVQQVNIGYLCFVGVVSGLISIVPGMSVSLMLMLFGVYDYLLQTASGLPFNLPEFVLVAAPVGICFAIGMVLFSTIIKMVFDRYPGIAYFMVFGFMCGTIVALFPKSEVTVGTGFSCGLLLLIGLSISVAFQLLGKRWSNPAAGTSL